ncbi:hypothetical protein AAHE18_13G046900 [Arachis hypogaea]|nr:uncharacterized protein DS421_13g393230 [Arachis hypogaea]
MVLPATSLQFNTLAGISPEPPNQHPESIKLLISHCNVKSILIKLRGHGLLFHLQDEEGCCPPFLSLFMSTRRRASLLCPFFIARWMGLNPCWLSFKANEGKVEILELQLRIRPEIHGCSNMQRCANRWFRISIIQDILIPLN